MINQEQLKSILAVHLHLMIMDVSFAYSSSYDKNRKLARSIMHKLYVGFPSNEYELGCSKVLSARPISEALLRHMPRNSLKYFHDFYISSLDKFSGQQEINQQDLFSFMRDKHKELGNFKYFGEYKFQDLLKCFNTPTLPTKGFADNSYTFFKTVMDKESLVEKKTFIDNDDESELINKENIVPPNR